MEVRSLKELVKETITRYARYFPSVRRQIESQKASSVNWFRAEIDEARHRHQDVLPEKGKSTEEVLAILTKDGERERKKWDTGHHSGSIYHGAVKDMQELFGKVFGMYAIANTLHPDVFFSTRQLESEVIRMVVNMYNGDADACGTITSGGTESILSAMKTYRDHALKERGITEPNIIIPVSAHAAFDKAGEYFKIAVKKIPLDPTTGEVDLKLMKRATNSRTICLVGSSPNFPHGTIDPISDIAAFAKSRNIGCHTDACLGGFLLPFMREAGFSHPPVDFSVPGVTSISCDIHKYGCSPKGISVVMYRSKSLRNYQYCFVPNWQGGIYATPGLAGSKSGALAVCGWSALVCMGRDGYVELTKRIMTAARKIAKAIQEMDDVEIVGRPDVSVVAFTSKTLSIYYIADALKERTWQMNVLQNPPAVHICLTGPLADNTDNFIADLKVCIQEVKNDREGKYSGEGGTAAIYGTALSAPQSVVSEILGCFLDVVTES